VTVGAVINGFTVTGRTYTGGPFDWFTAFNLFCGVGLVVAYALLGSTWLVMKSENALQQRMRQVSKRLLLMLLVIIAAISAWTPLTHSAIAARWFTLPNLFFLLPVPVLVVVFSLFQWRSLNNPASHNLPFVLTLGLIFLGLADLGSASGRTLFRHRLPCGRPPRQRKVRASCWWGRC
jgi:cytochrome d ubiquinol oxidase subunit II